MDTRPVSGTQRASALVVFILFAFTAFAYLLDKGRRSDAGVAEVAGVAATGALSADAPIVAPARGLAFPLAGFEHALRDNYDEMRGLRRHRALDIMAPRGTPVRAVDDGRIAKLYRGPMAGIAVYQFDAAGDRVYFYAHLDRYAPGVAQGREVKRGDVIGYVGSTGNAPKHAPHLHFGMYQLGTDKRWWKGTPVNPYELLRSGLPGARPASRP